MKDIVILADFCGPLDGTHNSRFLYLGDLLAEAGHRVEIVTSDFDHGSKRYITHEPEKHAYPITMLHEGAYPRNVCLRRFAGHAVWGRNVGKYLKQRKKPDAVLCAVPPLSAPRKAAEYCARNGIRFVADIQDLWPEAFQMVLPLPAVSRVLLLPLTRMADAVFSRADAVCAVSETYAARALRVNRKGAEGTVVYLGTDLSAFDAYAAEEPPLRRETEEEKREVWLAYCGTLGASYDLTCVINALARLPEEPVRLIAMGDGPRRAEFEAAAKRAGIRATFTGLLEYRKMCALLARCDLTVNPITHGAAQSVINKHADYAAAGLPVVSTQENAEYRNLVEKYRMGFNCANGDDAELAERIRTLIRDEALRKDMGRNARQCAEEVFDRRRSYQKLVKAVLGE